MPESGKGAGLNLTYPCRFESRLLSVLRPPFRSASNSPPFLRRASSTESKVALPDFRGQVTKVRLPCVKKPCHSHGICPAVVVSRSAGHKARGADASPATAAEISDWFLVPSRGRGPSLRCIAFVAWHGTGFVADTPQGIGNATQALLLHSLRHTEGCTGPKNRVARCGNCDAQTADGGD